jgi:hypothetical protein
MGSKVTPETLEALRKIFRDLGLDFPGFHFIEQDALYTRHGAKIHEVDRTPVIVLDDGSGGGGSGEVPTRCFEKGSIDLGGQSTTDNAGRLTWKLDDYICRDDRTSYLAPTSFVTTALSTAPVFLTARMVSGGVVDVFSWGTNGAPAPNVRFAWRCWVPTEAIVT